MVDKIEATKKEHVTDRQLLKIQENLMKTIRALTAKVQTLEQRIETLEGP